MSMKLMNQGKRIIDGKFKPGAVAIFDDSTGEKLMKLYPREIVDVDNLKASYDETAVKDLSGEKEKKSAKKAA